MSVYEWCLDYFDDTRQSRVLRGTFWGSRDPGWNEPVSRAGGMQWFSPANRRHVPPDIHTDGIGFRIVLENNDPNANRQ